MAARLLLDGAGGLFGLYLLICAGLLMAGQVMRVRRRVSVPGRR